MTFVIDANVHRLKNHGDVVVFSWPRDPRQSFVTRILGLPGARVRVRYGSVIVNGVLLDEPYVQQELRQTLTERVVKEDSFYVLGDNRAQSDDSRHWGVVPRENLVGKVQAKYWPIERFTVLGMAPGMQYGYVDRSKM